LAPAVPADPLGTKSVGQLTHEGLQDPRFAARVQHYLADHGVNHPQRMDLQGRSPLDVAHQTLTAEVRDGRTVAQWIKLAQASDLLALAPTGAPAPSDLATDVARLDADAGAPLSAAQKADVARQAAALPADVRAPFADLVHAMADAYEAQSPVASAVVARAASASGALDITLTDAERESTIANAMTLLAAQNAFRLAVKDVAWPDASVPLFRDPEGLVILGSTGNDVYERTSVLQDPVLIVDPSGSDTYHTTAGAACPDLLQVAHDCNGLVISVVIDLTGNDSYAYAGEPTDAQGSASLGGIGLLVDILGDDHYLSSFDRTQRGPVFMYVDGGAQGYGLAGVGILLDAQGNDVYEADITSSSFDIWGFSQGFGNVGGVGIAADGGGNDQWLANGFDSNLTGCCFQGLYPGGTGFYGAVGILSDAGQGADQYHAWDNATTTDFYAYGFGAFGGVGIFAEDGGNDDYAAVESASNPFIVPLLNCAYGTGSFGGLGVFVEMGGNDHYFGDSVSPRAVYTMNEGFGGPAVGEGLFVDVSGDDGHFMQAHAGDGQGFTAGRGILLGGGEGITGNSFGVFLDAGGADQYTGAAPSRDNAVWPVGMDFDAGLVPQFFVK
jgi:hypothetical protein